MGGRILTVPDFLMRFMKITVGLLLIATGCIANLQAAELYIGTATVDITPKLPVALLGQFELRIAQKVETPLTVNVVALESREGDHSADAAIMVSCDLTEFPGKLLKMVRENVQKEIPGGGWKKNIPERNPHSYRAGFRG
jgi:hypothetical protein